jgi:hypothetical protein
MARIRYTSVSPAAPRPETVRPKSTAHHHTVPLRIRITMRSFYFLTFALAGTVAAAAAIALGTSAAALPHRQAAESHAIPLLATAALSAALLGTAAGAATDRRS